MTEFDDDLGECEFCGYSTRLCKTVRNPDMMICQLCRHSTVSSLLYDPRTFSSETREIMEHINRVGNFILDEIRRELKGGSE